MRLLLIDYVANTCWRAILHPSLIASLASMIGTAKSSKAALVQLFFRSNSSNPPCC